MCVQFSMLIHLIDINKTAGATCDIIHYIPVRSALCAHNSRCTKLSCPDPPPHINSRPPIISVYNFLNFLFLSVFSVLYCFACNCSYFFFVILYFSFFFIFFLIPLFLFRFSPSFYFFHFVACFSSFFLTLLICSFLYPFFLSLIFFAFFSMNFALS